MAVLGIELVGQNGEIGNGIFNDGSEAAVHVSAVVVSAVNGEAVVPGPQTANGPAGTRHAAGLGGGIGKNDRQFLHVAADGVNGELFGNRAGKSRLDL